MEYRIFSDKPTSVSLEFLLGTNSYRLFRNFVKRQSLDNADTAIKMLLANIDKQLDSPQGITSNEDAFVSTVVQQSAINAGQGNLSVSIGNLSQKIDLIVRSIANLQSQKGTEIAKEVRFDTEILDGFAHRIDGMIREVLQEKVIGLSGEQGVSKKVDEVLEKLNEIKHTIASKNETNIVESAYSAQLSSVSKDIDQKIYVQPPSKCQEKGLKEDTLPPLSPSSKDVSSTASKPQEEKVVEVDKISAKAVVGQDIVRYPVVSKKIQPKCFGHVLSKDECAETPCASCVQVNACSDATKKRNNTALPREKTKPECFGQQRHDLECSMCKFVTECGEK